MTRWLQFASIMLSAALLGTPVKADVSWDFIMTDATAISAPGIPPPPPSFPLTFHDALTVSDDIFLRGSLFYSHIVVPTGQGFFVRVVTGDTDFRLSLGVGI